MLHWMLAQPFLSEATDAERTGRPLAIAPAGSGFTADKNNRVA